MFVGSESNSSCHQLIATHEHEQVWIKVFAHGWMPLVAWPQVQSTSTWKLCPFCNINLRTRKTFWFAMMQQPGNNNLPNYTVKFNIFTSNTMSILFCTNYFAKASPQSHHHISYMTHTQTTNTTHCFVNKRPQDGGRSLQPRFAVTWIPALTICAQNMNSKNYIIPMTIYYGRMKQTFTQWGLKPIQPDSPQNNGWANFPWCCTKSYHTNTDQPPANSQKTYLLKITKHKPNNGSIFHLRASSKQSSYIPSQT